MKAGPVCHICGGATTQLGSPGSIHFWRPEAAVEKHLSHELRAGRKSKAGPGLHPLDLPAKMRQLRAGREEAQKHEEVKLVSLVLGQNLQSA